MGGVGALFGSHYVTNRILYIGKITQPAITGHTPRLGNNVEWTDYKLKAGGNIQILSQKNQQKINIKNVWICFPGNGCAGDDAIETAVHNFDNKTNNAVYVGIDYPGYGKGDDAHLHKNCLRNVAYEVFDYVKSEYPNANINVYGWSLGGFLATVLLNMDKIENFYLHSPIRLDAVLLQSKLLTYILNWENLNYVDNMLEQIPKRKNKCNMFIVSGDHSDQEDIDFLSLYDTLDTKYGRKIKEKLIDTGILNLQCKIKKGVGHCYCPRFSGPNLKKYDILTGKAEGD